MSKKIASVGKCGREGSAAVAAWMRARVAADLAAKAGIGLPSRSWFFHSGWSPGGRYSWPACRRFVLAEQLPARRPGRPLGASSSAPRSDCVRPARASPPPRAALPARALGISGPWAGRCANVRGHTPGQSFAPCVSASLQQTHAAQGVEVFRRAAFQSVACGARRRRRDNRAKPHRINRGTACATGHRSCPRRHAGHRHAERLLLRYIFETGDPFGSPVSSLHCSRYS